MIKLNTNSIFAENHFKEVEGLIRKRITNILKTGYINKNEKKKGEKKKFKVDKILSKFLKALLINDNLKKLITIEPNKLIKLTIIISKRYPAFICTISHSNRILYNIFISNCYEKGFNKLEFINMIGIDTCPYCNRNYIYTLDKVEKIKPQIDHFFPKSIFPFLGMSFYNLIPSCQTCNGEEAKGSLSPLKVGLTNPYLIKSSDFTFGYNLESLEIFNPLINKKNLDKDNLSISITTKMQGHLNVFKLDK